MDLTAGAELQTYCSIVLDSNAKQSPLDCYEHFMLSLKSLLTRPRIYKISKSGKTSKPWFDGECKSMKRLLSKAYFDLRNSCGEQTQDKYNFLQSTKRAYKLMIVCKKKNYVNGLWKSLTQAAKNKNPSLFWKSISDRAHRESSPLDAHVTPDK